MEMTADAGEAPVTASRSGKSQAAFRTISEVADELDVAQHVLRFWESKFPQVRPLKRGGGRRYYRPEDIDLLRDIRALLYDEGYTIKGAQKLLRQRRARPPAMPPTRVPATQSPAAALIPDPAPAGAADRPQQHRLGDPPPPPAEAAAKPPLTQAVEPDAPVSPARETGAAHEPEAGAVHEDVERLREVRDSLAAVRQELAALLGERS